MLRTFLDLSFMSNVDSKEVEAEHFSLIEVSSIKMVFDVQGTCKAFIFLWAKKVIILHNQKGYEVPVSGFSSWMPSPFTITVSILVLLSFVAAAFLSQDSLNFLTKITMQFHRLSLSSEEEEPICGCNTEDLPGDCLDATLTLRKIKHQEMSSLTIIGMGIGIQSNSIICPLKGFFT